MLLYVLALIAGLAALYYGAEWLVNGSVDIALRYGIRRAVIGITIVALGTSMPEFVITLIAVVENAHDLGVGNIVGSNISNIGFILGLAALLAPIRLTPTLLRREYLLMMIVLIGFYWLILDGQLGRVDGIVLVLALVGFLYFLFKRRRPASEVARPAEGSGSPSNTPNRSTEHRNTMLRNLSLTLGGMVALAAGAQAVVYGGTGIAEALGVDALIIGLSVVAIGSSLPELAASLVSIARDEMDVSVGNIVGSNLLNIAFVMGIVAIIQPTPVSDAVVHLHAPIMLGICAILPLLAIRGGYVKRWGGAFLLLAYSSYLTMLALPYLL